MNSTNGLESDPRFQQILDVVMQLAAGNLEARGVQSENNDSIDALILGINMLAEEIGKQLKHTQQLTAELVTEKERTIAIQKAAIEELSTPVIQIWDDILVLPLVGSMDTARANNMLEALLTAIESRQATVVIIDITGIPIIDTMVAKHLIMAIQAATLLGAQCIMTGVSPQTAQTLSKTGVSLEDIVTKGNLQRGLQMAFTLTGRSIKQHED